MMETRRKLCSKVTTFTYKHHKDEEITAKISHNIIIPNIVQVSFVVTHQRIDFNVC